MNIMNHMELLGSVNHATSALSNAATVLASVQSAPSNVSTSHYDASGTSVAATSNTSFSQVNFDSNGKMSGGTLVHNLQTPDNKPIQTASITLQSNGCPGTVNMDVNNKYSAGLFKKISMDLSAVTWTGCSHVESGQIKLSTLDVLTNNVKTEGTMTFANEKVTSGSFKHYALTATGGSSIKGYSEVDYSNLKFLGTHVIGGSCTAVGKRADQSISSQSQITLNGLGRIQGIQTTNFDSDSRTIKSTVSTDFSGVQFNALGEIQSGNISYVATDKSGTLISKKTVAFANCVPTTASVILPNAKIQKVITNFNNAKFNNQNRVVDSAIQVSAYDANNNLVSNTQIFYDSLGNKIVSGSSAKTVAKASAPNSSFPLKASVSVPTINQGTVTAFNASNANQQVISKKRSNGVLEETITITTTFDGKPQSAQVTQFDTDGSTITGTYTMQDFSTLSFDSTFQKVSGNLNVEGSLGGTTLSSKSVLTF